jgi:hypothetical protein
VRREMHSGEGGARLQRGVVFDRRHVEVAVHPAAVPSRSGPHRSASQAHTRGRVCFAPAQNETDLRPRGAHRQTVHVVRAHRPAHRLAADRITSSGGALHMSCCERIAECARKLHRTENPRSGRDMAPRAPRHRAGLAVRRRPQCAMRLRARACASYALATQIDRI